MLIPQLGIIGIKYAKVLVRANEKRRHTKMLKHINRTFTVVIIQGVANNVKKKQIKRYTKISKIGQFACLN